VYGYKAEDIKVMTDDVGAALDVPTRDNIVSSTHYAEPVVRTNVMHCKIAAMHELIKDAHAGDRLVFHCMCSCRVLVVVVVVDV
jgi:hypothetical protein